MPAQKGITFRRVNGRIIPIKIDGTPKQLGSVKQGALLAAAGVGVLAATGRAYPKLVKQSVKFGAKGFAALERVIIHAPATDLFQHAAKLRTQEKVGKVAMQFLSRGARLGNLSAGARVGGLAAGSALLGAGLAKLHQARNPKATKAQSAGVAGTAATAIFLTSGYGGAGARQSLKGVYKQAYPAFRALKLKWKL